MNSIVIISAIYNLNYDKQTPQKEGAARQAGGVGRVIITAGGLRENHRGCESEASHDQERFIVCELLRGDRVRQLRSLEVPVPVLPGLGGPRLEANEWQTERLHPNRLLRR